MEIRATGRIAFTALVVLLTTCSTLAGKDDPQVKIKQGVLRGKIIKTYTDDDIFAFLGIPYAAPPTKSLRFKPPQPPSDWEGVRDATSNRQVCAQLRLPDLHFVGVEDCLFINVYTTMLPKNNTKGKLAPVIAYIHGGLFFNGNGDFSTYNPLFLLDDGPGSLVFVTFNYRLGALGFLSTEDEVCPGNSGLKDQVFALRWIRDNIALFGGDPTRVTLMGDNAGAVSAHLHMMSPMSKGLFHAAISQSGTALTPYAIVRDPLYRTQKLSGLLSCGNASSQSVVKCLQQVEVNHLLRKSNIVATWRTDWMPVFTPIVESPEWSKDAAFLIHDPRVFLTNTSYADIFNAVPWLVGVTSQDGLPHSLQLLLFRGVMTDLNEKIDLFGPYYFGLGGEVEHAQTAAKLILSYYFRGHKMNQATQLQIARMHTDFLYFAPLVKSVAYHVLAKAPPVYIYHFSFQKRKTPTEAGVPQSDDTHLVLPRSPENQGRFSPSNSEQTEELKTARRLAHIIINFATSRQPISKGDTTFAVSWPPADDEKMYFIDFGSEMKLNHTFYPSRMAFWEQIDELLATGDCETLRKKRKAEASKNTETKEKNGTKDEL